MTQPASAGVVKERGRNMHVGMKKKVRLQQPPFKSDTVCPQDTNEENSTLVTECKQGGCLLLGRDLCTQRQMLMINSVNYAGINLLLRGGLNYFPDFVMYLQVFYII